ncbi:hypothetical protein BN1110_00161 [bacterium YEK0313]|nr:hypothetical protein BN1110_00161 [bacterium YEK0313]
MGFYRKNIGSLQQASRVAFGLGAAAASYMLIASPYGLVGAAAGIVFALTGIVGYCPFCALAGLSRDGGQGR